MLLKMKWVVLAGVCLTSAVLGAADLPDRIWEETPVQKANRMSWWTHDRFGMFIHFGLYSMPARHEWIRTHDKDAARRYPDYFRLFDPDLFDARKWARDAKQAGMKYVVLTTKHHEGFCLFDSKFTDFKITKTPFGRDLVKELVEAVRAEGLRVGFYYSLIDWQHPDFTVDKFHPLCPDDLKGKTEVDFTADARIDKLNAGRDMNRYRQYMKDQVTELLTNYGKIDIMWFDFSYQERGKGAGKGREDWDSVGLVKLARRLQPGIILDNRCDLNDTQGGWDFLTPEQYKVSEWPTKDGVRMPWETCQTFSGSWGYHRDEATWKDVPQLLSLLTDTVAHGGNLILNVGPTGRGEFDGRAKVRLSAIGEWMRQNGRAIYGCTEAPKEFVAPAGTKLTYDSAGERLYIHLFEYPMGSLNVDFPKDRIDYVQFLHDASEIAYAPPADEAPHHSGDKPKKFYGRLFLPVTKPQVEIPVIEVFLKARNGETGRKANETEKRLSGINGLVSYWDFGEMRPPYRSKGPYEAALSVGDPHGPVSVAGGPLSGRALRFDGSNYLTLPYAQTGMLNVKSNQVTVVGWVRWLRGQIGFVGGMWNEYQDGGKRQYGLFVSLPHYNGANRVCGHISKAGGPTKHFPYSLDYSASAQEVPDGEWCCVAFTYDGKQIKSYLNGRFEPRPPERIDHTAGFIPDKPDGLVHSKNPYCYPDGIGDNGSDFTVGAVLLSRGMGNFFRGDIGGLAVFNRALTEQELEQLATAGEEGLRRTSRD